MLNKLRKTKLQKADQGFTIIEVMIVLAIGGLILLIVFLAVPALQRNGRNTQRKADVGNVLSGVSEYISNNGGALPTTTGPFNTEFSGSNVKLGFFLPANVKYDYKATVRGGVPPLPAGNDGVIVYNYLKCGATPTAPPVYAAANGVSVRSVVAYYAIESSSGDITQCVES